MTPQSSAITETPPKAAASGILALGEATKTGKVMIIDDDLFLIEMFQKYLRDAGYENVITTADPSRAFKMISEENPDVVLTDLIMPHVNGHEIIRLMRENERLQHIPILVLSVSRDVGIRVKALELGATDFLNKPVDPHELIPRVRNALVMKAHHDHLARYSEQLENEIQFRTAQLEMSRKEVIRCLARAAEYRDDDTGKHIMRVGGYAGVIASELDFPSNEVELLEQAAQLHDIGKIGIPDGILRKPGMLNRVEADFMKNHCQFGANIIQSMPEDEWVVLKQQSDMESQTVDISNSPILLLSSRIAMSHHEKWDGSGYPKGLSGEDIPIEGRITAVADVFDALTSERPYKPPFPREKCLAVMEEKRGSHFDPRVLDAFFARLDDIYEVQAKYAD